jgi:Bacterial transcriptional activator domain
VRGGPPGTGAATARTGGPLRPVAAEPRPDRAAPSGPLRPRSWPLWRGEPYADFADEEYVRAEAARPAEQRLAVYERLADARRVLALTNRV